MSSELLKHILQAPQRLKANAPELLASAQDAYTRARRYTMSFEAKSDAGLQLNRGIMNTITIEGKDYPVIQALESGLVIAKIQGTCAYAWFYPDGSGKGEWWAGSPTPEDAAALKAAIEGNGGFDQVTVTITRGSK